MEVLELKAGQACFESKAAALSTYCLFKAKTHKKRREVRVLEVVTEEERTGTRKTKTCSGKKQIVSPTRLLVRLRLALEVAHYHGDTISYIGR